VFPIGQAVLDIAQHPNLKQQIILTTGNAGSDAGSDPRQVRQFDIRRKKNTQLFKYKGITGVCFSGNGSILCATSRKTLLVWNLRRSSLIRHVHLRTLTAITAHPKEGAVATADSSGRIQLWYELDADDDNHQPRTATMHWHAHAVPALCFNSDGTFLVSGGEEMVLVIWQLDTGQQQFLPRLGEAIRTVTVDSAGSLYGCVCSDNAIRVVDAASMEMVQYVQGVYQASPAISSGLLVDPLRCAVAFSGRPGVLQFFDYRQDKSLAELEVVPQNVISRTDDQAIAYSHVQHAAFSSAGDHLITVDTRENLTGAAADAAPSCLKFWAYDEAQATYVMNTRSDVVHKGAISALVYHPKRNMAVTCGDDFTFKLWHVVQREEAHRMTSGQGDQLNVMWQCQSVGTWREVVPSAAAFSSDGALLAVVYGSVVTLWQPNGLTLLCTLPHKEAVKSVNFLACSPMLAVATAQGVYVWDLLTCNVWWSYAAPVRSVAVHPHRPSLALLLDVPATEPSPEPTSEEEEEVKSLALENKHVVVLFRDAASSAVPSAVWPLTTDTQSISFVPASGTWGSVDMACGAPMHVLAMSTTLELALLSDKEPRIATPGAAPEAQAAVSVFEATFGASLKQKQVTTSASAAAPLKQAIARDNRVFGGTPSHAMPPLSKLFGTFMTAILPKRSPEAAGARGSEQGALKQEALGSASEEIDASDAPSQPRVGKRKLKDVEEPASAYDAFVKFFGTGQEQTPSKGSKSPKRKRQT